MNTRISFAHFGLAVFCLFLSMQTFSQSIYQQNNNVLGVGIGLGGAYQDVTEGSYSTPMFNVNFERAIWPLSGEKLKGIISMGGLVGYKQFGYSTQTYYYNLTYSYKWRYTLIAARAAWHLQSFKGQELKKWDLYSGLMLGANYLRRSYEDNDPNFNYGSSARSVLFLFGGYFGARYFFNQSWAASVETGFGYSALNFGVSCKL